MSILTLIVSLILSRLLLLRSNRLDGSRGVSYVVMSDSHEYQLFLFSSLFKYDLYPRLRNAKMKEVEYCT